MKIVFVSCMAAIVLGCGGCKSAESPAPPASDPGMKALGLTIVDTAGSKPTPRKFSEIKDTAGIGAFLDSLRADVQKGRLDYVRQHFVEAAREDGIFFGLWDEGGAFKDNPKFVRATADLLTWTMRWGKLSIDTLAFQDSNREWLIFYPSVTFDTSIFSSAANRQEPFDESDSCRVFLGDTSTALLDAIGGKPVGAVGSRIVCQIEQVGGYEPHGYSGTIGTKWMKIRTKDGREGWLPGDRLVDFAGPGLELRLIHREDGWKIANFVLWNDEG